MSDRPDRLTAALADRHAIERELGAGLLLASETRGSYRSNSYQADGIPARRNQLERYEASLLATKTRGR